MAIFDTISPDDFKDYAQLALSVIGFVAGTGAGVAAGLNRAQESKRAARAEAHQLATTLFNLKNRFELLETRRSADLTLTDTERLCLGAEVANIRAEVKVRARRAEELLQDTRFKLTTAESLAFATALSNPPDPAGDAFWREVLRAKTTPTERLANLQFQADYLYRAGRGVEAENSFAEARKIIADSGDDPLQLSQLALFRGNSQCVSRMYADGKKSFDEADAYAARIEGALGEAQRAEVARYRQVYAAYLPA